MRTLAISLPLLMLCGCELFGGKVKEYDSELDRMEAQLADLEKQLAADPENQALKSSHTALNEKYHKLLAERNKEAEKASSAGDAASGLLGLLGVVVGIPILGAAGRAIGGALKREPRAART